MSNGSYCPRVSGCFVKMGKGSIRGRKRERGKEEVRGNKGV
jgi:hypothetical protein